MSGAPWSSKARVYGLGPKGCEKDRGKPILVDPIHPPTMHELMPHTAGFTYGDGGDTPVDHMVRDAQLFRSNNLQEFIDKLAKLPLLYQPGQGWTYSVSMDIVGHIVEKLSSQTLPDFMRDHIYQPLGMKDAGFYVPFHVDDSTSTDSRLLVQMAPLVEVRPICSCPRQPARKRTRVARGRLFRLGYRQYKKKDSGMEGPHHDLPIRLAANELLLRACRRHNVVHPQIFHHLAVVVIPMGSGKSGYRRPRTEPVNRLDGDKRIFCRNGR